MAEDNQRADSLRRLAVIFQDIVAVADDYDKIGSIKDHIRSLESKRQDVLKAVDEVQKDLDQVRVTLHNTREQVSRVIGDANEHARRILDDAQIEAQSKIAEAETRIEAKVRESEDTLRSQLSGATQELAEKTAAKEELEHEIESLVVIRDAVKSEGDKAQAHLDEVKAQIQKLRSFM